MTHRSAWASPGSDVPVELSDSKKHDRVEHDFETTVDAIAGDLAAESRETTACECGVISSWMRNRPVGKDTAYEMVDRMVDRLDEEISELAVTASVDENELWETFKELKTDPDQQFADDRIFAKAVDSGITIITAPEDYQKVPA